MLQSHRRTALIWPGAPDPALLSALLCPALLNALPQSPPECHFVCIVFSFWLILWGTQKNMPFPFCTIIGLKATCFPNEISLWRTNSLAWEVKNVVSHFLIPAAHWFPPLQRTEMFIVVHVNVTGPGTTQPITCWRLVRLASMILCSGLHSLCT